jgi:hypothetical protein
MLDNYRNTDLSEISSNPENHAQGKQLLVISIKKALTRFQKFEQFHSQT